MGTLIVYSKVKKKHTEYQIYGQLIVYTKKHIDASIKRNKELKLMKKSEHLKLQIASHFS